LFAVGALFALTACGGGSSKSATTDPAGSAPTSGASGSTGAGGNATGRGPAASGEIAAVAGTTMQVQSQQNGQVAVTWTATTRFTQQATLAASSIKAGDCVTIIGASGTATDATAFTAATVAVRTATNGSCTGNFGGGGSRPSGGAFPSGGTPPSGGSVPSGGASRSGGAGGTGRVSTAIASGSVVSVSGSTVVVAARDFTGGSSATTTNKTVTLAATTKITGEKTATAAAVKVGLCATAQGKADSSGTVTATSVSLTDAVNGACTAGFGGGFGGRFGSSGANGSPSSLVGGSGA
jgi:hypothetical protein